MKRERPADDARRTAIIERLRGTPTLEIARGLDRKHETIKGDRSSCGVHHDRRLIYPIGIRLIAEALFTPAGHRCTLGAVWDGRSWVGHPRNRSTP